MPVSELRVGGAVIHHSHQLAAFGNNLCSVVFCGNCGGSTQGSHSPLLFTPCRREARGTRRRQARRMLELQRWPVEEMQHHFGTGVLSHPIQFEYHDEQITIMALARQQPLSQ